MKKVLVALGALALAAVAVWAATGGVDVGELIQARRIDNWPH